MNLRKIYLAAKRIVETLETVDNRCMAVDGDVPKTESEWTPQEKTTVVTSVRQIASEDVPTKGAKAQGRTS